MNRMPRLEQGTVRSPNAEAMATSSVSRAAMTPLAWEDEIARAFASGRTGNLDLAKTVASAKGALPRGQWTQLWKSGRLPFSKRKGEMLAVVGAKLGSLNAQTFARLPAGWSVLYQLARLDLAALEDFVRDGTVHPTLTLRAAKELIAGLLVQVAVPSRQSKARRRLRRFQDFVRSHWHEWPASERNQVATELRQLADELAEAPHHRQQSDSIILFPENPEPMDAPNSRTATL